MKNSSIATTLLILSSVLMPSTPASQLVRNEIGIYTVEVPDLTAVEDYTSIIGVAETPYRAYVVCVNPYNYLDARNIDTIGGFELRIEAGFLLTGFVLHPSSTNMATSPDFICGGTIPVVNGMCTLITINFASITGDPAVIHLAPVSNVWEQTFPGGIALLDLDGWAVSEAYASSGDLQNPVFGFNVDVVSNTLSSWGGVKALYR